MLVGVYAWRYGWIPPDSTVSVTEQEFDYAREKSKRCLCYIVDESHPWLPVHMESGKNAEALKRFKDKVSRLVRSTFTTPDNLAKQIAADVARELTPPQEMNTVGGILQVNWDRLSPELQLIILDAYKRAKIATSDGVVATHHIIAAMEALPNTSGMLFRVMPEAVIEEVRTDSTPSDSDDSLAIAEVFGYQEPFSHCVLGSLQRLLPSHSANQRLMAIEVAADILKNGRGNSVQKFRRAGIDGMAVERLVGHTSRIAADRDAIRQSLDTFDDTQITLLAYEIGLTCDPELAGAQLRDRLLRDADSEHKVEVLAGEVMRRNPNLLA